MRKESYKLYLFKKLATFSFRFYLLVFSVSFNFPYLQYLKNLGIIFWIRTIDITCLWKNSVFPRNAVRHGICVMRGQLCIVFYIQRATNQDLRALLINCQILTIYIDSNSVILPCTIMIKEALLKWYNVIILQIGQGHRYFHC